MDNTVISTKKVKAVCTKKIVEDFTNSINTEVKYSLDELKKLLTEAYKSSTKKDKGTQKREPSKYNIFVKNEIIRLRAENPETNIKDVMSKAASNWRESKLVEIPTVV